MLWIGDIDKVHWRKILGTLLPFLLGNVLFGGVAMFFFAPATADAADSVVLEFKVKAAMLYKFLDYIEWPASAFPSDSSPYIIAVIGAEAIATELKEITALRTVNNRRILITEVGSPEALVEGIHMLFIGRDMDAQQAQTIKLAQQYSIVTVTENPHGLDQGSVINFRLADGHVKFDVSLIATEERNVKVSARMLAVASSVTQEPQ